MHGMFLFLARALSGKMKNDDKRAASPSRWKNPVDNAFAAGKQGAPAKGMPMKCNEKHNDGN